MGGTVLLIEDEPDLASAVAYALRSEGFDVQLAATGGAGLARAIAPPLPDVIILDLMLPDLGGTEVCRRLRGDARTRQIPVMMCTAKGTEIDRIVGFELGADDYVVKPFSVRELCLRVRALARRTQRPTDDDHIETFGTLRIHHAGHRAWVDDQEVVLTALEFKLLWTLVSRRGRVQTREILLTDVWGVSAEVTTRTVDTHVKRLREKLGETAGAYIETLRGVGYRFQW
jgi:two-component system phosphate regulon response regulator PhoB